MAHAPLRALRARLEALRPGDILDVAAALRELERVETTFSLLGRVSRNAFGDFERGVRDLSLLQRAGELFACCFEMDRLCEQLLAIVADDVRAPWIALYLQDEAAPAPLLRSVLDRGFDPELRALAREAAALSARCRRELWIGDARKHSTLRALTDSSVACSLLCLPLGSRDDCVGALQLADSRPDAFRAEQMRLLRPLASLASLAIRHARLCESLLVHQRRLEEQVHEHGRELDEARGALRRHEKMAALGKLAASIAHEINNPMSYVLSNVTSAREQVEELQSEGTASPERLKDLGDLLGDVSEGLERVRSVAYELKSFGASRPQGAAQSADLSSLVQTAVEIARSEAPAALRIETRLAPVAPIRCHRYAIVQIVLNLLINALEVLGPSGSVRVTTSESEGRARIEVSDDGPGIPAEVRARIFEPFFTTKSESNSGLGLAISRDLAEAHGGTLELRSGRNGATFVLTLPVEGPPSDPREAEVDPARD